MDKKLINDNIIKIKHFEMKIRHYLLERETLTDPAEVIKLDNKIFDIYNDLVSYLVDLNVPNEIIVTGHIVPKSNIPPAESLN